MQYLYNDRLTNTEIEISNKINENMEEVVTMSISELADFCGVSPSKITKYSYRLGFSGYKDLIYQLRYDLKSTYDSGTVIEYTHKQIEKFFLSISQDQIRELGNLILDADKIYLYGQGPSSEVTTYFLSRLRIVAQKDVTDNYEELLNDLKTKDDNKKYLVIILTVSGKSSKVHEVLNLVRKNELETVVISGYLNEELKRNSNMYVSLINGKEVFNKSLVKGRMLFFIYFEMLIEGLVEKRKD